jgi:hypothetical protein
MPQGLAFLVFNKYLQLSIIVSMFIIMNLFS